jgi:hypothetical protein
MTHATRTGIGIAVVLLWSVVALAATCEQILDSREYDCSFVDQANQTFRGCVRFSSPGTVGDLDIHGDVNFPAGRAKFTGGCSCAPTGNVNSPAFDASSEFDCLPLGFADGLVVSGKAGKTEISRARMMEGDGSSVLFTCVVPKNVFSGGTTFCPACQPAGELCGGLDPGPCCAGLTCSGPIGQQPRCN